METTPEKFAIKVANATRKHSTHFIYFSSSMVTAKWAERFAKEILRQRSDICWITQTRADPDYTPDLCATLRKSGCLSIDLGVESLSPRVLKAMHKPVDASKVQGILEAFYGSGILPFLFMLWGFPGETLDDWATTLNRLRELLPLILGIHFSKFMLVSGSQVFQYPDKYGVTIECDAPDPMDFIPAKWDTQALDEEKNAMLAAFLSSLPPGYSNKDMDVYRKNLPFQMEHCNAYLYYKSAFSHAPRHEQLNEGCLARRIRSAAYDFDEVHIFNLDTGRYFRFPGETEPLIDYINGGGRDRLSELPYELAALINRIQDTVNSKDYQ